VLVSYGFRSDLARIIDRFKNAVDISTPEGFKRFMSSGGIGVAHPKSMGHGVDGLQNICYHLVRFSQSWNMGEQMQMAERIGPMRQLAAGFNRVVQIYDLIATNTLDEDMRDRQISKRNVQDALLLAMKRRG
jgi:hypothetical protein